MITLLPFQIIGGIGALTALDFLGFGLQPPTPSWGGAWPGIESFVCSMVGHFHGGLFVHHFTSGYLYRRRCRRSL